MSGVHADIDFVGLRPGEKLHDTLISDEECLLPSGRDKILLVDRVSFIPADFADDIAALIDAAQHGQLDRIAAQVERIEPGFSARGVKHVAQED